jgi:hypothetical protein
MPWGTQLYGLPHGMLHVFNTILYENEFQNHQILKWVASKLLKLFDFRDTELCTVSTG